MRRRKFIASDRIVMYFSSTFQAARPPMMSHVVVSPATRTTPALSENGPHRVGINFHGYADGLDRERVGEIRCSPLVRRSDPFTFTDR